MSLSPAVPRRHMNTRRIQSDGYKREDGLWDIESHIIDEKTYAYTEPYRGRREPGSPVHHMLFRLTVDDALVVRALEVSMPGTPYSSCNAAVARYQGLVGRTIGRGWRRAVLELTGGTGGCTHVTELLIAAGSAAVQTLHGWPEDGPEGPVRTVEPQQLDRLIDSCIGLVQGSEGALHVASYYPGRGSR